MNSSTLAAPRAIGGAELRGRGIGMLVGAGFGSWWAFTAINAAPAWHTWPSEAFIALVTAILVAAGVATIWRGRRMAASAGATQQPRRHVWRKFLLVLVAEIVALNFIFMGLTHYHLMAYVVPAIAIIVGLHFYPLARTFRAPYMHITATLMTLAGIGAVGAMLSGAEASAATTVAAAICAITLWMTAAIGWLQVHGGSGTAATDAPPARDR